MLNTQNELTGKRNVHDWLHSINISFAPGATTPILEQFIAGLRSKLLEMGQNVQEKPDQNTDVIITTAPFGESVSWRKALIFNARRLYNLDHTPTFYTLVQASPEEFQRALDHFTVAIQKEKPDPADFKLPGLAEDAYTVLYEQGIRGGPILALERVIQAQAKSIRVLLVIADDQPLEVYHFDLVGAYPCTKNLDPDEFYKDIALRLITTMSTTEVKAHQVVGEPIENEFWAQLKTPDAMLYAARKLGERNFFTDTIRIAEVVDVPYVSDSVADQYSEGCFASWDPELGALIATVTGSARPVHKGSITEADLAVIVGVREDGMGAIVREVEGKQNDPPSSEAVELIDMDSLLPKIKLGADWDLETTVPVVRSKLHGHRGIKAYDPCCVEYIPLDPPYYDYPVSCATNAQAQGIKAAFSRSKSLQDPEDTRQVAFTVLPGHGTVIVEKWVPGKEPFQVIWEYMDAGFLEVDNLVPQGRMEFLPGPAGRYVLRV